MEDDYRNVLTFTTNSTGWKSIVFKAELSGWSLPIGIGTRAIQSSLTPRNETYLNGLSTSIIIILSQLIFNALSRPGSFGANPCGSGRNALAAGYAEMNPNLYIYIFNEICISIDLPLSNAMVESDAPKKTTPRS